MIDHAPDLVAVSYGLNDARGGTPIETFRQELVDLVSSIKKGCDPLVVLLGPYFFNDFTAGGPTWSHANHEVLQAFNLIVASVAKDSKCLYTDVYQAYGGAPWMVHYDGVHANDLGHRVIANSAFQTLAQHCPGLAMRTKRLERTSERWRDESMLKSEYGQ